MTRTIKKKLLGNKARHTNVSNRYDYELFLEVYGTVGVAAIACVYGINGDQGGSPAGATGKVLIDLLALASLIRMILKMGEASRAGFKVPATQIRRNSKKVISHLLAELIRVVQELLIFATSVPGKTDINFFSF